MDTEKKDILILAIESSCDETAAAVVKKILERVTTGVVKCDLITDRST